jgi:hypothetical protein
VGRSEEEILEDDHERNLLKQLSTNRPDNGGDDFEPEGRQQPAESDDDSGDEDEESASDSEEIVPVFG